jgi:hypothetical protein
VAAIKRAYGGDVRKEVRNRGAFSPEYVPDAVRFNGKSRGKHVLYELKVGSPTASGAAGTARAGSLAAFGNTLDAFLKTILGTPAADGTHSGADANYPTALRKGHTVTPIIMEVFGGFSPGAASLLDELAKKHGASLGADEDAAPWCARSFKAYHSQRISVALHLAAADEILETIRADSCLDADAEC